MKDWIDDNLYNRIKAIMPIPTVDIIVLCEEKVLLLERNIPPLKGYWSTPGGRIEIGETPEQAAKRELKEETGLEITSLKEYKSASYMLPDRQHIGITFYGITSPAVIKLSSEHSKYIWALVSDLPIPMHPISIKQIKGVMEEIRNGKL